MASGSCQRTLGNGQDNADFRGSDPPCASLGMPVAVEFGDRGEKVKRIERALKRHGFAIEVDGHYWSDDRDAVRGFFQKAGLDDDGRVVRPDALAVLESPSIAAARDEVRRVALSRRLTTAISTLEDVRDRSDLSHVIDQLNGLIVQLQALPGEIDRLDAAGYGQLDDLRLAVSTLEARWLREDAIREVEEVLVGLAPEITAQQESLDEMVGELGANPPQEAGVGLIESRLRTLAANVSEAEQVARQSFDALATGVGEVRRRLTMRGGYLERLRDSAIALSPGEKLLAYLQTKRISSIAGESDRGGALCLTTVRLIFEDIEKRGILFFAKTTRSVTFTADRTTIRDASLEMSDRGSRLVVSIAGQDRPETFHFPDANDAAVVHDLLAGMT